MTGFCRDCKWWGEPFQMERHWTSRADATATMAECSNPKLDVADDGIESTEDAPTNGFYTGPQFGCVHFEPKEKVEK